MKQLTDRELLQRVWIEHDPLTSTEAEGELARRFEAALDEQDTAQPLIDAVVELIDDIDVDRVKEALQLRLDFPLAREFHDVLTDYDIDDPAALRASLARLRALDDALTDIVAPLQSLTALATTE